MRASSAAAAASRDATAAWLDCLATDQDLVERKRRADMVTRRGGKGAR